VIVQSDGAAWRSWPRNEETSFSNRSPPPIPPRAPGDPRRFPFAIVCMRCGVMEASLQKMRTHLGKCPGGRLADLLCGHCELRTTSWPVMCDHLNKSGMQEKVACRPEYRMSAPSLQLFPTPLHPLTPTTLRDIGVAERQYQGQLGLSPEQLTLFRSEAARLRRGYHLTPFSPSPSQTSSRAERSNVLRSTILEWCARVDVARPHGEVDVVEQDVTAGSERCSPPVILARCDLTPRIALWMPPLRPWAPCVRATFSQLVRWVSTTSRPRLKQNPRKKGEPGHHRQDRPFPGRRRTSGLWKPSWGINQQYCW